MNELSDYLDEAQACLTSILIDVDENNVNSKTMDEMIELEGWVKKIKEALIKDLTK